MSKKKKPKILLLVDFENLFINVRDEIPPEKFSIEGGFNRVIRAITEEVGEIVGVFAFLPSDRALVWDKDLYELQFNIVLCPRIKNKEGVEKDTTDSRLLELGEWLINHLELSHVFIGSGDKDFSPLMKKAAQKGLKKGVVAANLKSLSSKLIQLTDTNPSTGKKMVYLFSPIEE